MKVFLAGICSVVVLGLQAQTVLFSDDFEGGFQQSWKVVVADTLTPSAALVEYTPGWVVTKSRLNATDSVVGACSFFDPAGTADRWLISPAITLGALNNVLTYRAHSVDPSFPERYTVLLSTTGDNPADFIHTVLLNVGETPDWNSYALSLSDSGFVSQTVYLAFVLQTNDGFVLELDDIAVTEQPLASANEIEASLFTVYPNPAGAQLHIKGKATVEQTEVLDLNGRVLLQNEGQNSIAVNELETGTYVLRIFDGSNWTTRSFVKL